MVLMKKDFNLFDVFGPKSTEDRMLCKKHRRKMAEKINNFITLYNDDCIRILKGLDDDSISCCITDPPYHLTSSKKDNRGFMGQGWDGGDIAFSLSLWKEVLRVLKPGAHLLAFGSPRTSHRMVSAIEMAGFDIRDSIMWLYGEGMPKCHNIAKAVDKQYGAIREVIGHKDRSKGRQFAEGKSGFKDGIVPITVSKSEPAKALEGWDSNLKPSHEPIVVARKPLEKGITIAQNVLAWGTGAMNIGACKIENLKKASSDFNYQEDLRRHPANTIISEEVAIELGNYAKYFYCPKPTKEKHMGCEHLELAPTDLGTKGRRYDDRCENCRRKFIGKEGTICDCPPDKKKTAERNPENYYSKNFHNTVKPISLMEYLVKLVTPPSGVCIDPFMGSGSTGIACSNLGFNFIGIEQDKNYYEISKARINYSIDNKKAA